MKNQDNTLHVLFCSRLVLEKWADILLKVIERSISDANFQGLHWHISSDGDFTPLIQKLSLRSPWRVTYYGRLAQNELSDIMRKVDYVFMPSRFLETFWLTALESLACGTPVIGIKKWWLIDFIDDTLGIDESDPVESSLHLFHQLLSRDAQIKPMPVEKYNRDHWTARFEKIFPKNSPISLLHDYQERIGWAEAYIEFISSYLPDIGYSLSRCSYSGATSNLKRRIMFILSILAFWRWITVSRFLEKNQPQHIWMHSILRYFGYWWVRAVRRYVEKHLNVSVSLSHHDVWFIAPFPQSIYNEDQIPKSSRKNDFLREIYWWRRFVASVKWHYICLIRKQFPKNLRHIIFSSFLESHIKNHFPWNEVVLMPHTYDETIFHPL